MSKRAEASPSAASPPVAVQYASGAYSDFVEDPRNTAFYDLFIHHSFFREVAARHPPPIARGDTAGTLRVLDVGCGNAILSRKLLLLYPHADITALDLTPAMVERAAQLCKGTNIALQCRPFSSHDDFCAQFDLVMSGFVVCHLGNAAEVATFFKDVSHCLRPGGQTLHIVPPSPGEEGSAMRIKLAEGLILHDYQWSTHTLLQAARDAGLVDVTAVPASAADQADASVRQLEADGYYILCARKAAAGE